MKLTEPSLRSILAVRPITPKNIRCKLSSLGKKAWIAAYSPTHKKLVESQAERFLDLFHEQCRYSRGLYYRGERVGAV